MSQGLSIWFFKSGHCAMQNRPSGIETGQHPEQEYLVGDGPEPE
jgi:hypothetical protein